MSLSALSAPGDLMSRKVQREEMFSQLVQSVTTSWVPVETKVAVMDSSRRSIST